MQPINAPWSCYLVTWTIWGKCLCSKTFLYHLLNKCHYLNLQRGRYFRIHQFHSCSIPLFSEGGRKSTWNGDYTPTDKKREAFNQKCDDMYLKYVFVAMGSSKTHVHNVNILAKGSMKPSKFQNYFEWKNMNKQSNINCWTPPCLQI